MMMMNDDDNWMSEVRKSMLIDGPCPRSILYGLLFMTCISVTYPFVLPQCSSKLNYLRFLSLIIVYLNMYVYLATGFVLFLTVMLHARLM